MIITHIGIYGICIKDNKLLCIKREWLDRTVISEKQDFVESSPNSLLDI